MPQPKSTSGRSRKDSRAKSAKRDADSAARLTALRDLLARAVMLPSDKVREAMDDAVRRGRMTRDDAEELAQSLISIGRRQAEDVLADFEQLLGRPRAGVMREVDRARRAAGIGGAFPITGYDDLAAAEIISRLDDLTPAELRKVRDYERRHGNRKTVLAAADRKLG